MKTEVGGDYPSAQAQEACQGGNVAGSQCGVYRNEPETQQEGPCRWHHGPR